MSPTETIYSKVTGVTFYTIPWDEIQNNDRLLLVREPDNAFDPNAIAIHLESGCHIGHINRVIAADLAPLLDEGAISVECSVSELTGGGNSKNRGCNIKLLITYSDEYMNRFRKEGLS